VVHLVDKLPVNAPFWGHRLCLLFGSSLRGVTFGRKQIKLENQNNRKTVGFFLRVKQYQGPIKGRGQHYAKDQNEKVHNSVMGSEL
jgi:hypothetical protein